MEELSKFLDLMVKKGASDLHLTVGRAPILRLDGELVETQGAPLTPESTRAYAQGLMTREQAEAFDRDRELDFSHAVKGLSRFRVNAYHQRGSVGVAIRRIPFQIPQISDLGLPLLLRDFAERPNGLFLVTGPTGSGKSTTLAAMIDHINETRACHIITIEDPIEYLHAHKKATIEQREVGFDTASFAEALRRVVRQDPNVIMVGEMRDLETVHTALTLAETGHLVLATLHTSDTAHSISRIIDIFPPYQQLQIRFQLSLVLIGVVAQQLLHRKDGPGRVVVTELMSVSPAIGNLIRENQLHQISSAIQTGARHGMHTMNQSLASQCNRGSIGRDDALGHSPDPQDLAALLQKT